MFSRCQELSIRSPLVFYSLVGDSDWSKKNTAAMMSIVGKISNIKEMVKFLSCMKLTLATLLIGPL